MKKLKNSLKIIVITMSSLFSTSCDLIVPGSNLMAERYDFSINVSSLMDAITKFNSTQGFISKDSTFKIEGNPYYYYGVAVDKTYNDLYHLGIHKNSNPVTLLLISVENIQSGEIFGINHEPANKEEIMRRKAVMKNFEERVLDKLGPSYVHKGNAMNKKY